MEEIEIVYDKIIKMTFELRHEKTGFLHMRKQRQKQ